MKCLSVPAALLALIIASPLWAAQPVTLTEQQVTIPTYLLGPPDPNPRFYFGGDSQGAQHRIYPYPAYDNLTTEKVDKPYKMVYLENEYIKVGILPDSGGKIFEAIDKTNGYNFFYRQHVIKPALISLLGAWISGGVEWDIPHHHRATSFLPVQYTTEESRDGSKTVWVGELELRDRMRWAVGITLHPGKSTIEASFRIMNRTPLPTSMLSFSNVAVHVDDTYQVIFPPSTQHVTYHGKRSFTTWPIATTRFNNTDFSAGVDVSWYKNHFNSNSMFAWNYQDDFFAGYDHGKNAGVMSIADHTVVPGKKFWTWGNGPGGRAQDTLLTDNDGPYIELMVGAYSDNQPDYSWLQPYETRTWSQFWYPFRDIDGVKFANIDGAVNLDIKDGKAHLGFYTTADHPAAKISLKFNDQVLLDETIAINPGKPCVQQIDLPSGADEHDLRATLTADGITLTYAPAKLQPESMPAPVIPYLPPEQIKTTEELYLTGLRIEQFHTPGATTSEQYWNEALKRDPADVRTNTALAVNEIKAAKYAAAEAHLRTALQRATNKYTTPEDGAPFYYLGLALKAQGKLDDAYTQFTKSTWSAAWRAPGYFEAAQIASLRGDAFSALALVDHSLEANSLNIRALALKSALLRQQNRTDDALAALTALRKIDPLDVYAAGELMLLENNAATTAAFLATVSAHPATLLDTASDYLNAGLYRDGSNLLSQATNSVDASKVSPLVYYYLAQFAKKLNQPEKAAEYYQLAAKSPTDFVFPFQMEMIPILEDAIAANPADARAPYYLGNLLYDVQPDRALALWEKSAELNADFPVVYRNLAMVYTRNNQRDKALAALEKAVQFGGNATIFYELDKLYEENGVAPEKRLALLDQHQPALDRDEIIAREINLDIFAGNVDRALTLLQSRFFRAWEGGGRFDLGDSWVNANLLRGNQHFAAAQYTEALADYQSAAQLPANLQEAAGNLAARHSEIQYRIGTAYDALHQNDKAQQAWTDATTSPTTAASTFPLRPNRNLNGIGGIAAGTRVLESAIYYRALAFQKLGQPDQAAPLFQQLADTSAKTLAESPPPARTRLADAHYIAALGQFGLGKKEAAKQELLAALRTAPDHLAAKSLLAEIPP